jgi:hypothetical protein
MSNAMAGFYRKYRKTGKGGSYRIMEWALRNKGVTEENILLVLSAIRDSRAETAQLKLNELRREREMLALIGGKK